MNLWVSRARSAVGNPSRLPRSGSRVRCTSCARDDEGTSMRLSLSRTDAQNRTRSLRLRVFQKKYIWPIYDIYRPPKETGGQKSVLKEVLS